MAILTRHIGGMVALQGQSEGNECAGSCCEPSWVKSGEMSCRYRTVVDMGQVDELPRPYALAQLA